MNRSISISTDVFATIWAHRVEGEETEDAILRRVLGCQCNSDASSVNETNSAANGYTDTRNGVTFPHGFIIFRTYKRKEYSATAEDGAWKRTDTGESFPSLNQLNASITAGNENVWNGTWKYKDSDGTYHSIATLRR
ncbi:hypothetical protein [Primorskyibacter sp. 2E233]|uniref:hypothetical protein n=1 Tax=Primorskyibacter sp. 2E233 TaxID=3413431 RepID=UPI003BF08F54